LGGRRELELTKSEGDFGDRVKSFTVTFLWFNKELFGYILDERLLAVR